MMAPRLEWLGSGTAGGYHIDLYQTPDGRKVIIGSEHDNDQGIRKDIAAHYNTTLGERELPTPSDE